MSTPEIPTSVSLEGRLTSDPVLQHSRAGHLFVRVQVEAEPVPVPVEGGGFADVPTVPCELVLFGKAAERMTTRFRFGDRFVASGRVKTTSDGTWFVARRIGHDAARTTYRVTRARRSTGTRAAARRSANSSDQANRPTEQPEPIVAGRILPDVRTA